jgi:hypothetical protein
MTKITTDDADLSLSAIIKTFSGFSRKRLSLIILAWIVAAFMLGQMIHAGPAGWDAQVYWKAMQSLHRGGDPYAEGIAAQGAFHNRPNPLHMENSPFTYVYSPMTLPVLRWLAVLLPGWWLAVLYGATFVAAILAQFWAGWQMADKEERATVATFMPFVVLFPGLLYHDVIMSANIAYILYGMILAAAVFGWKRDQWTWYYIAVLIASVFKAPLLTLIAFPILVGRRQWLPAGITGAAGLALFGASARLWPQLFSEYMRAVFLQFEWNRDFGFSPSGLLGNALAEIGITTSHAPTILYLVFASVIGIVLLYLGHRVRQGYMSREMWIPVALLGTVLANPRIKEYDVAAITIPMLLIARRAVRLIVNCGCGTQPDGCLPAQRHSDQAVFLAASGWMVLFNCMGVEDWKYMELGFLLVLFLLGTWSMYQLSGEASLHAAVEAPVEQYAEAREQLQRVAQ